MIRNLKALGLALVAVFALSVVAAPAASAQEQGELTSDGPVTLLATETTEGSNSLAAFGLTIKCPGSTITGHKYTTEAETKGIPKNHTLLPNVSTTATLTPHWKEANENCRVNPGNFAATVDMNDCDFVIHLGKTTGGVAHTYGVTFDVICPTGKEITVTVWTNNTDHTAATTPMCILHVTADQTGLEGAHATYLTNEKVRIHGEVKGIHVLKTKTTHSLLCPEATTADARFNLDMTVEGKNSEGLATGITITDK